jgi:hypothetical protein
MNTTYDWITFKVFSPRQQWSHLLKSIDDFLNDKSIKPLIAMRVIEFNQLNDNIQLSALPQPDKRIAVTTLLETFLKELSHPIQLTNNINIYSKEPALLALRVLLSDVMIEAFRSEPLNDETIFTLALYLHLTVAAHRNTDIEALQYFAGLSFTDNSVSLLMKFEAAFAENRELFEEMKKNILEYSKPTLPPWIATWMQQYKPMSEDSAQPFLLTYMRTVYLIIKQLGLTEHSVLPLEYFIRKIINPQLSISDYINI